MLKNFKTLEQAKKDRDVLQQYIDMVENYETETLAQRAVLEYALHGSLEKAAKSLNKQGLSYDGESFDAGVVTELVKSKPAPKDDLHRTVRSLYHKRTRPARRGPSVFH